MQDLQGKVAVVTGAGSGIGRGIAHALAEEGMNVVIADIELEPAEKVAAELRQKEVRSIAVRADVTSAESLKEAAARTEAEFGVAHVLCNNAGVFITGPIAETSPDQWGWLMSVNVMGVVNGVHAFLPLLRKAGEAHIVNTASSAGLVCHQNMGIYTATKYAVVGISETLRNELAEDHIGVSVLCPGSVQSRIFESERNRPAQFGGPAEPAVRRSHVPEALDSVLVGRMVAQAIKDNRLHVHTHLQFKEQYAARFQQIADDFAPLESGQFASAR